MLEKEFKYYLDHQKELVKKYNNKYIVIVDEKVVGSYDTQVEAFDASSKDYKVGAFLIQLCTPGEESYTHVFHSRVMT